MPTTTYEYRGKKTLLMILILRLIPAVLFLIAVIILAAFRSEILSLFGTRSLLAARLFTFIIQAGISLFFLIAGVGLLVGLLDYYGLAFAIEENAFKIRDGILNIQEISILYRQIQNVDVNRPLIYRFLGMSKLVILTSGEEDAQLPRDEKNEEPSEGIIDLIDAQTAERLQEILLERAHIQVVTEKPFPSIDLHTS